ncbi:MAG: sensor histidine kinase [Spirochaetia bacterium]|nr:sensor histidine kinase [Spirochaetia bacterium]
MHRPRFSRRFLIHIFLSLLLTGLIQVLLLGLFSMLFSTRMLNDTYRTQSAGRIELLVNTVNTTITGYREATGHLAKNERITSALFGPERPEGEQLSLLYQELYKNISGKIDHVSLHFLNLNGRRSYSTHVLPPIYDPNSSEQSLSTYLKLKGDREVFPMVDSFINQRGDRVAISLFRQLEGAQGQQGFIIADLNLEPIIEELEVINAGFFSNIYLLDNINYKFVSLFREGEAGNFSGLGWKIPRGSSGVMIDDNKLIAYASLYPDELSLAATLTIGTVTENLSFLIRMVLIISVVGLILSSLMAYALAKNITRPVSTLVGAMKRMEEGDLSVQVESFNEDEFEILFHGFNEMSTRIRSLLAARVAREQALRTAERKALQSQMNPHFLYNTLNTVKAIAKLEGIESITTIVTQLGKLLRDSIDAEDEFTTIGKSLQLVEAYLQIQKIRYGESFTWEIQVDQALYPCPVPRLIIQPIVENSVIHGLEGLTGEKRILITGKLESGEISVIDNGAAMSRTLWEQSLDGTKGVGLHNVHTRLRLHYGEGSGLSCSCTEEYTTVTIHLNPALEIES